MNSKHWKEFSGPDAPKLDFVITACDKAAKELRPWLGQPLMAHWGIPDPAGTTVAKQKYVLPFADTLRMIRNRIEIFVRLPLVSLDQLPSMPGARRHRGASGKTDQGRSGRLAGGRQDTSWALPSVATPVCRHTTKESRVGLACRTFV